MIAAVIGDCVSAMPPITNTKKNTRSGYGVFTPIVENKRKPNASDVIPRATVRLWPNRAMSLGVSGETIIMIGAIGRNRRAAPNALKPMTSWKYCVKRNITPNIDMKTRIMPPVPTLKAGLEK